MEVGNGDLGLAQLVHQLRRHDLQGAVVVARIAGQQDPQPVADGNARGDDEKGVGESSVLFIRQLVQRLPGNEHCHDRGFAGAGGHFAGDAEKAGIVLLIELAKQVLDPGVAVFPGGLGKIDKGFQGLDLAKEQPPAAIRITPILQQAGGYAGDIVGITALAPDLDHAADFVDGLILFDPALVPVVERQLFLVGLFLGLGDGDEIATDAAILLDFAGNAFVVELEMSLGLLKRGVDNRVFNDDLAHLGEQHSFWRVAKRTEAIDRSIPPGDWPC